MPPIWDRATGVGLSHCLSADSVDNCRYRYLHRRDMYVPIVFVNAALLLPLLQAEVESDTEEDEFELEGEAGNDMEFTEDRRKSEDLEEDLHSSKFRAEGQLMNYEEDPSFEGYLQVKV